MKFLALLPVVFLAGCCSGQRASIAPAAATATVTEVRAFGVSPEVKAAITIPPDVAECVIDTGTDILKRGAQGLRCVLDRLAPTVVPTAAPAKAAADGPECRPVYASPAAKAACR